MTRQEHADAVVANLRAGKIDAREVILPPPPPVDADDLAPWMRETARPTAPAVVAPDVDGMTHTQVRTAMLDLHHQLTVTRMERDEARSELKATTDAHTITLDECVALRQSIRAAEAVIADLRAKVAERDALVTSLSTRGRVTSYWAILGDGVTVHAYACFGVSLWLAYSVGTGGSVGSGSNPREAVESLARNLGLTGALVAPVVEVTHALDINDAVVDAIDGGAK